MTSEPGLKLFEPGSGGGGGTDGSGTRHGGGAGTAGQGSAGGAGGGAVVSGGDAKTGGVHEYYAADLPGQIGLTEAMFDWLEDASRVHPTNLQDSLTQFNVILGLYMSALERRGIDLPVEPDADLLGKLRKRLARA